MAVDLDTKHVRCFLAVAEELSFTRAAERLGVHQTSLSRTIAAVERMVGERLLDRTSRRVRLTRKGEELKVKFEQWLFDLDRILTIRSNTPPFRLGFTWLLPEVWTQQAIETFEADTAARVELIRRDAPYAGVDRGDTDMAVLRGHRATAGLRHALLFWEPTVAALHRDSPAAGRSHVDWAELADQPLVVNVVSGTTQRSQWPAGHRPSTSIVCANLDEWLEALAAGRGVGIASISVAHRVTHPLIRFVPLAGAPPVPVYLAYPQHGAHPLADRFVRAAQQASLPPYATSSPPQAAQHPAPQAFGLEPEDPREWRARAPTSGGQEHDGDRLT